MAGCAPGKKIGITCWDRTGFFPLPPFSEINGFLDCMCRNSSPIESDDEAMGNVFLCFKIQTLNNLYSSVCCKPSKVNPFCVYSVYIVGKRKVLAV